MTGRGEIVRMRIEVVADVDAAAASLDQRLGSKSARPATHVNRVPPVLVMNGTKTDERLKEAARAIAEVISRGRHNELAGQTHNVKPDVLTPAVVEFLTASRATPSRS